MCTDTYAGSISDNDLTADCGVLDMIQDEGATVLTDKGFGIEDVSCQRPFTQSSTKEISGSVQGDRHSKKTLTLRIYNENFIGRMRDWLI